MTAKDKEITTLRLTIEIMKKELDNLRKNYDENMEVLLKSIESQLVNFKERETFSVNQLLQLEGEFNNCRTEKDRLVELLKSEIEELRNHNVLISKLKNDKNFEKEAELENIN